MMRTPLQMPLVNVAPPVSSIRYWPGAFVVAVSVSPAVNVPPQLLPTKEAVFWESLTVGLPMMMVVPTVNCREQSNLFEKPLVACRRRSSTIEAEVSRLFRSCRDAAGARKFQGISVHSANSVPIPYTSYRTEHTEKIFFECSAIGDRPPHPSLSRQGDQPRSTRCINITDSQPWYLVRLYL